MPQMSPMWWTTLMLFFMTCSVLFFIHLFFNFSPKTALMKPKKQNSMIWKW